MFLAIEPIAFIPFSITVSINAEPTFTVSYPFSLINSLTIIIIGASAMFHALGKLTLIFFPIGIEINSFPIKLIFFPIA